MTIHSIGFRLKFEIRGNKNMVSDYAVINQNSLKVETLYLAVDRAGGASSAVLLLLPEWKSYPVYSTLGCLYFYKSFLRQQIHTQTPNSLKYTAFCKIMRNTEISLSFMIQRQIYGVMPTDCQIHKTDLQFWAICAARAVSKGSKGKFPQFCF